MFRKAMALLMVLCVLFTCMPAMAAGGLDFTVADKPEIQVNPPKKTQEPLFEEGYGRIENGSLVFTTAGMKDELGSFAGQSVVWVSARAARDSREQDVLTIHFAVDGEIVTGYLRAKRVTPLTADEAAGYERLAADGLAYGGKKLMPVRFRYAVSEEDPQKPQDLAVVENIVVQTPTAGKPIPQVTQSAANENKDELDASFTAVSRTVESGTWYDLTWTFDGSTLTISGEGDMEKTNPGKYPWSSYSTKAQSVVIGEGVKTIAKQAFSGFRMSSLTLGPDLWIINIGAFTSCSNLTSLTIPAKLVYIYGEAFAGCTSLASITYAENCRLNYIGKKTFDSCFALTTIALPDSVTELGEYAFQMCTGLETIDLGNGVEILGNYCFLGCTGITGVVFPDSVRTIGDSAFSDCNNLTSITFGSGLESLGDSAFGYCEKLTGSVTIPATVTEWGANTFEYCNLTEANIYCSCEIGNGAFYRNNSLAKVTLGDTVTGVGPNAFYYNTALTQISIPASVTSIGYNAFIGCEGLSSVTFAPGVETIAGSAFAYTSITSLELPDTVTQLFDGAFKGCTDLETLKLSRNITTIPDYCFYMCGKLSSVTWPAGLTTIGEWAFYSCESLTNIPMLSKLETIDFYAFAGCDNLQSVATGEALTTVDSEAFKYCYYLESFTTYSTTATFGNTVFSSSSLTIYGFEGSTAQAYANSHGNRFEPITVLDKPISHKIVNTVQGVHVYWQRVPAAATYTLWRSNTKSGNYTKVAENLTVLHYTDKKVTSGTTYYYKVVAHNGQAKSPASEAKTIIYVNTPDITSRFNKAAGIVLGWNKVTGATGYAIYRKSYGGSDAWSRVGTVESGSTLTWTDTSVKNNNGTAYRYTVRALAGSARSILSGCRTTGRTMVRLCSQTLKSADKASNTSIKASWSTSAMVTGYEVRFMVGTSVYKTVTIGNYKTGVKTFTGLPAGKTYKVQVRTYKKVDGVGSFYSAWSAAKNVTLP